MPPSRRPVRFAALHATSQPYSRANAQSSSDVPRSSASVAHSPNGRGPLRLTVKAPPSKLRQAISGSQIGAGAGSYADDASDSDATPRVMSRAARSTRNARPVIEPDTDEEDEDEDDEDDEVQVEQLNDEDDEDQEEDEDEDEEDDGGNDERSEDDEEDAEGDDDDDEDVEMEADQKFINKLGMTKDSDEDAEGEDDDDDIDEITQDSHPPPRIIKHVHRHGKPSVTLTLPPEGPLKSVEAKEMDDDEDDDELSELEEEEEGAEDEEEDDEEMDDDDDDEGDGSRSATPDLSKLTRRQRAYYEDNENDDGGLMALSNEAQKKKHLTAEEHAMRRAEMARRRKNLSEKRNEEEKMDTINKLLKKPAPKRRTRLEIIAAQHAEALGTPGAEDGMEERADPLFVRWTNSRAGIRVGVPDEWRDSPAGQVFQSGWKVTSRPAMILVEEVL